MNDFYIKGVTILSKTPAHNTILLNLGCIGLIIGFILLIISCMRLSHKHNDSLSCLFSCLLFFIICFGCIFNSKINDTYLVSIDETASYIELDEKFSDITKLENGLYEVELNVCD